MEKCSLFLLCDSPSKRNGKWACVKSHEERMKMCVVYIIGCKLGWVEIKKEKSKEKISIPEVITGGLV